MDNQPGQPTQPQQAQPMQPQGSFQDDFLSRMDAVNHPVAPEPEKKGLSKGALIGIIVGAVAIIGVVVGAVMMLTSGGDDATPTVTATWDDDEPEIDAEMEARNKKRAGDLKPLGEAVKLYQAQEESEGQLPGPENEEWESVISFYTPEGKIVDGATGETYKMGAVCKFGESCVDISSLTWEENAHEIYALYNADCKGKTKENVIVSSTRLRRVAIFAIVEGGQFICTTN